MNVRAKFECQGIAENDSGTCTTVVLHAVYGDGTDNAAWSQATPWGKLEMAITNPAAVAAFQVGQAYYLDSSSVEATQAIQVGNVIDPIPEVGHDGPQYVTAVTEHPDGTALDLRPATPEEIAATPTPAATTLTTQDGTTIGTAAAA